MMTRSAHILSSVLLCVLCAVPFAAQTLGFLGAYTSPTAITLTLLSAGVGLWLYWRYASMDTFKQALQPMPAPHTLSLAAVGIVLLCLSGLFVLRLSAWPLSDVGANISGDLVDYHLIKAIELYRTGSIWDVTIIYGQYPIGYESYAAFSIVLTGDILLMGVWHALIVLLLYLTLFLLLRRYTLLADAVLLLLALALLFVPFIYSQLLLVGKNDVLLSTALLIALLHTPIGPQRNASALHIPALAFATMLAMSVKATGVYLLAFLWLLALWHLWRPRHRAKSNVVQALPLGWLLLAALIIAPSGLWIVRNYVLMGSVFSPEVASFFGGSILANLTNPALYAAGDESLTFIAVNIVVGLALLGAWLLPHIPNRLAALLLVMWLTFFITPLGAFHTSQSPVPHIEWRYTLHSFLLLLLLAVLMLEPPMQQAYAALCVRRERYLLASAALVVGCFAFLLLLNPLERLRPNPDNLQRLRAPTQQTPRAAHNRLDADDYAHLYAYVRDALAGETLLVIDLNPFYLYDADYTTRFIGPALYPLGAAERVQQSSRADAAYAVLSERYYHDTRPQWTQQQGWQVIYDDALGVVLRRIG